jgi:cell wall-associated NlpC family hydrolase
MSKADAHTARSKIGKVYPLGCTGFVADVLGRPQKHSSQWTRGEPVSKGDLGAGDVVGWGGSGEAGHVLIYDGSVFLNCPGPGQAVKENGSMGQQLYRMTY